MISTLCKRLVWSAVLSGGLMLCVANPARADRDRDYREDCQRRLESDRARIDRDVARHGEHGRQVDKDVEKMNATREWCRDHKAEWDHDRFDIGVYFRR
jgi:hypothetical protein